VARRHHVHDLEWMKPTQRQLNYLSLLRVIKPSVRSQNMCMLWFCKVV
jgi:hypothetical protein